jgi:hypothetical protein
VEEYVVAQDTWLTGFARMPQPRWFCGCAALDDKIYVIGGTNGASEQTRVDRFDPATNHWDTVASLPWPRQGLGACTYQGQIYAAGGYSGGAIGQVSPQVARFHPNGGAGYWTEVDSMETPRSSFGMDTADGRIYVAGGVFFNPMRRAEYYQPDTWSPVQHPMSSARAGLACIGYDHYLCALAGIDRSYYYLNSVEVLDCNSDSWTGVEPLNIARAYHSAVLAGDRMIVIGGLAQQGTTGSVETHALFFVGISETRPEPPVGGPQLATVVRGPIRIMAGPEQSLEIVDGRGNIVVHRTRSLEAQLAPGVYFARVIDNGRGCVTRKIIVVR